MPEMLNDTTLRNLPDEGPVVMVNLLRFRERSLDGDGTGWDAYRRYSKAVVPMIQARGGTVLWAGDGEAVALGIVEGNRWDYVVLARYPSRAVFLEMMESAEYAEANVHRVNAAADHAILAARETYSKFKDG
jgi:uncharacterized protein (DUF1330 family)